MEDFFLDIEAKITVKPVTPKTGLTHRPPFERNMYVIRERTRKHFYGTKAQIATFAENAQKLMARQWALHGTAPPEVYIGSSTVASDTAAALSGIVIPNSAGGSFPGDDLTITFEYGTTKALGTSESADYSTTTPSGAGTTHPPDVKIAVAASLTGLTASTQYFWRIKVVSSGSLYTIWSQIRTFKTNAAA